MMVLLWILFILILLAMSLAGAAASKEPKPGLTPEQMVRLMAEFAEICTLKPLDPADDGQEVSIIRIEKMHEHGGALHWTDPATGRVVPLSRPMGLYELMDHFGCERG